MEYFFWLGPPTKSFTIISLMILLLINSCILLVSCVSGSHPQRWYTMVPTWLLDICVVHSGGKFHCSNSEIVSLSLDQVDFYGMNISVHL